MTVGIMQQICERTDALSSSQGGFGLEAEQIEFLLPVSCVTCGVFLKASSSAPGPLSIRAMIKVQKV